jgi:hypothetical protein
VLIGADFNSLKMLLLSAFLVTFYVSFFPNGLEAAGCMTLPRPVGSSDFAFWEKSIAAGAVGGNTRLSYKLADYGC